MSVNTINNRNALTEIESAKRQLVQQVRDIQFNSEVELSSISSQTGNFANSLQDAINYVDNLQNDASRLSAMYEQGEAVDITQLMIARHEASIALEATLQVKNKILSAYQEFMRMGV